MKKILGILAIALSVIMALLPAAFSATTSSSSTDFYYQYQHIAIQLSPDAVVPNAVPFCPSRSLGSLICYSPNFIRTAYNYPAGLDGTGQTILIVDAFGSPTIQNDLTHFDNIFGIQAPPSFTIFCGNGGCPAFNPTNPHDPTGWAVETSLDVEYAHAMAPGANIVLVVAATNSGNALNDAEASAIAAYPGSIMSQSFGIPEYLVHNNNAQIMQADTNYQTAMSNGDTVFASAGDSGATNGIATANANFPASDPFVTAVTGSEGMPYIATGTLSSCAMGATCASGLVTFTGPCMIGPRPGFPTGCTPTSYGGEQVWNEPLLGAATGGAPSLLFGTPSYQSGLGLSARGAADVDYNAAVNGGVLVYTSFAGPHWFVVGGTSAGSPQWAAIAALANQAAGHPLGFLNPAIYKILAGPNYAKDFHDITAGNNQLVGTPVGFNAVTGYDLASGVGTPNVANLVPDLVLNA